MRAAEQPVRLLPQLDHALAKSHGTHPALPPLVDTAAPLPVSSCQAVTRTIRRRNAHDHPRPNRSPGRSPRPERRAAPRHPPGHEPGPLHAPERHRPRSDEVDLRAWRRRPGPGPRSTVASTALATALAARGVGRAIACCVQSRNCHQMFDGSSPASGWAPWMCRPMRARPRRRSPIWPQAGRRRPGLPLPTTPATPEAVAETVPPHAPRSSIGAAHFGEDLDAAVAAVDKLHGPDRRCGARRPLLNLLRLQHHRPAQGLPC